MSGTWHFSVEQHEIDWKWRKVVEAIVKRDGALAKTGSVHAAKVSAASKCVLVLPSLPSAPSASS